MSLKILDLAIAKIRAKKAAKKLKKWDISPVENLRNKLNKHWL